MDLNYKLYLERANNEIKFAEIGLFISNAYQKLSQANLEPAKESLENAKIFFKHIRNLCE